MSKEVIVFTSPTCAPCKQLKPELNLSAYKELQKLDPATFAIVATCVTEKPGKPSVSIERITD